MSVRVDIRFRWARTIATRVAVVYLDAPFTQFGPIPLRWNNRKELFESGLVSVPLGKHFTSLEVVENTYQLDAFIVRSVTFEIDLYVVDDRRTPLFLKGEEEGKTTGLSTQTDRSLQQISPTPITISGSTQTDGKLLKRRSSGSTQTDISQNNSASNTPTNMETKASDGIKRSSLYEDLVRQQLSHGDQNWNQDAGSVKSERSTGSHHSDRGLISDRYRDGGDKLYNGHGLKDQFTDEYYSNKSSRAASIRDHDDLLSNHSSYVVSYHGNERRSNHSSRQGSLHADDHASMRGSKAGSLHEENYNNHSSRTASVLDSHQSYQGSQAGSLRGDDPHSLPGSRVSSRPASGTSNKVGSVTSGRPASGGSIRSPLVTGMGGSRPGSIASSERELSQFFDANDSNRVNRQSPQAFTDEVPLDTRRTATSSLPPMSTSQRLLQQDKRSYTPDTYSRVTGANTQPLVRSPLVTSRKTPVSSASTRTGSEASTPVIANGVPPENGHREDSSKVQDLEDTIATLKKLLADRDVEIRDFHHQINDLKHQNRMLEADLEETKNKETVPERFSSKQELERKYDDVLREKENLATEVWKLMQEIEKLKCNPSGITPDGASGGQSDNQGGLNHYSPNSPTVLQRKIEDLECQVQDLQEANETAVAEIMKFERENAELHQESDSLKTANSLNTEDLQNENQRLRDQIDHLNEQHTNVLLCEDSSEDVMQIRSELQQMRIDLRALRDKNHILNEENIRLRDEYKDIKRGVKGGDSKTSMRSTEAGMDMIERIEQYRQEKNQALDEVRLLKDELYQLKKGENSATSPNYTTTPPRKYNGTPPKYTDHLTSYLESQQDTYYTRPEDNFASMKYGSSYRSPTKWDGPINFPDRKMSPVGSDHSDSTAVLISGYTSVPIIDNYDKDLPDVIEEEISPRSSTGSRKLSYYDDDRVSTTTTELLNDNKYASLPNLSIRRSTRQDDLGGLISDSTNTTDLLYDGKSYLRHHSVGMSDASSVSSILDELDNKGQMRSHRSGSPLTSRTLSPSGFRSVSPPLTVTQHNKADIGIGREMLTTKGKRPFAPRTPADINMGDVVKFTNKVGRITRGTVKYVGHLPGRNESYLGVELEHSEGKHDGVYMEQRFFKCKPNKGVFVAFNKVVMVWGT